MAILVAALTFFSTLSGGNVALRLRKHLRSILGYTAGVLLGVVAFDLLPEIIDLLDSTKVSATLPMAMLFAGFMVFHIVEKSILIHAGQEGRYEEHHHPKIGIASALTLVAHSFLDGVAIGIGFQASELLGIAVAIAVIAHDFSDGLNTVGLTMLNGNSERTSRHLLLADALAPVAGALSTLLFHANDLFVLMYLGLFVGFLLYIATSQILPEAHSKQASYRTIGFTLLGGLTMFIVTALVP